MSPEAKDKLDVALQHVKSSRRDLLKRLLVGGGAIALQAPMANLLAAGTSNAAILKCIYEGGPSGKGGGVSGKGISWSVSGKGVATVTGQVKSPGEKDVATTLAKSCGATKVRNQLVIPTNKPR